MLSLPLRSPSLRLSPLLSTLSLSPFSTTSLVGGMNPSFPKPVEGLKGYAGKGVVPSRFEQMECLKKAEREGKV